MLESVRNNYKIFDFSFSVTSDSAQALRLFDLVYKNFRKKNRPSSSFSFEVVTNPQKGESPYFKTEEKKFAFHSFSSVENQCFKLLTDELYKKINSHLLIHGGGVAFQNKGVMICGDSGTGKTSLIVKLLTNGFKFLSDEIIPINKKTGKMEPFPRAVGLRPEARSWLKEEFALFKEEEFNEVSGHKYFVNPSLLRPERIGAPAVPLYFIYLTMPQSSPENNVLVHVVIKDEGQKFLDALKEIKGLRIEKYIKQKNDTYIRIAMLKKASVMKKYLEEYEKYKNFIVHTERGEQESITFNQKPQIKPLTLYDMSLLLLRQLKEDIIEDNLDGVKLKTVGSCWFNLIETLRLNSLKGYRILVGQIGETVRFLQDLVK